MTSFIHNSKNIYTEVNEFDFLGERIDNLCEIIQKGEVDQKLVSKQAEALKESLKKLKEKQSGLIQKQLFFQQQLIDAIPVPIVFYDNNNICQNCNTAFQDMAGLSINQLTGLAILDIIPSDLIKKCISIETDGGNNEKDIFFSVEGSIVFPDGLKHDMICHNISSKDENGKMIGRFGVFFDITKRKKEERDARLHSQQIAKTEKLASLDTLFAGMAHEINNPNTFITINAPLLQEIWSSLLEITDEYYQKNGDFTIGGFPYSMARKRVPLLLSGISEGALRIKNIVSSLKNFISSYSTEMDQVVHINQAIKKSIELTQNIISKSTYVFKEELENDIPSIRGNTQRIEQAIINIIINGCESLSEPTKFLQVSSRFNKSRQLVVIEVMDEGTGIPDDIKDKITDPFFTTKYDSKGTGLGLAISQKIIHDHGGDISFYSAPDNGTIVLIQLPVSLDCA
jgi:PAS domain S-box-containing protein